VEMEMVKVNGIPMVVLVLLVVVCLVRLYQPQPQSAFVQLPMPTQ
jgi:hypothetical protein